MDTELNVGYWHRAKADTTFDISGTFSAGAKGTLSGTIAIDVTALVRLPV